MKVNASLWCILYSVHNVHLSVHTVQCTEWKWVYAVITLGATEWYPTQFYFSHTAFLLLSWHFYFSHAEFLLLSLRLREAAEQEMLLQELDKWWVRSPYSWWTSLLCILSCGFTRGKLPSLGYCIHLFFNTRRLLAKYIMTICNVLESQSGRILCLSKHITKMLVNNTNG